MAPGPGEHGAGGGGRRALTLAAAGAVAACCYSAYLVDAAVSPGHDWFAVVSRLQVPGAPLSGFLRTADVVCGLLVLVLLPFVATVAGRRRWRRVLVVATTAFAIGCAAAALVPLPCEDISRCGTGADLVQWWVHDALSVVSQGGVFVGAAAVGLDTRRGGPAWLHRSAWATVWVGGVLGTVLLGVTALVGPSSWEAGLAQRFQISVTSLWILCLGLMAAGAVRRRPAPDHGDTSDHGPWTMSG
ncbi:DUF998 domain-containing protein [Phycicoccus sp. CSK15P-2]|uniref:DUF998 domain-containing protein n=1 Tax=Phycicoccus sp. CSK15P-2 TaxID=2807627 RepID=UPI00194FE933|nr:DUF998 domain-containing protein [Phycicoccus sp. CSK15P-2]MBM6405429.1 DUF998 domain-containing protein [Phycicoccus sp. CSK15P-2]